MEENGKVAVPQQQQTNQFRCTGNCLNCMPGQRAYCACQHAYSNMKVLDGIMQVVLNLQTGLKALAEKVDGMKIDETVYNPNISSEHNAQ